MQVTQVQVINDSIQDRLLMRIGTSGNEEIRVHLTRRYVRELWPHLVAMLADHLAAPAPATVTASPLNSPATAQNSPTSTTSFDQPYRNDNPTFPLGSKPILPNEAALEATGPGLARLIMREGRERAFTLNLNSDLLQALCAMLRAAAEQAQWDLVLDYGIGTPAPSKSDGVTTPATGSKKSLLH